MTKAKILVVEDENIVAKHIQNRLQSLGYAVVSVASSGEEAIEKAEAARPDLVLMDIMLRGEIDGVKAAEQIRDRLNIPVVYLTSFADDGTLQRAKVTEPFGYILKPFEVRELHSTIEMALYKHKMERELKQSQQWLITTLKSIGDAVIATDTQGFVKFINPAAETLTGWKQGDALGQELVKVFHIIHEKTRDVIENPAMETLREGSTLNLSNRILLLTKDGIETPVEYTVAPIRDDKGNILGAVLIFRDITEKWRVEEERLKTSKLESISTLAGGIAHDFNNILTAIIGNISLAKMSVDRETEVFERLAGAEKASLRAKNLTQQLLTFSKGGAPIKKTAAIGELIKDSASFTLRGSNVRCEFSIPEDLWPVEIDEGQMYQVIQNLVINAQQAMPEGGIIWLRAENILVGAGGARQRLPLPDGEYVKISLEDQGIGIPEEHLLKIFDPYFTTKQRGSGLGLATAYSIVKRHDGYLTVESKLGVGTQFHIYLPASQQQLLTKKPMEEKPLAGKGKVLVMDDEEIIKEVTSRMLDYLGYEVNFARDGAQALDLYKKARESGKPFDVIILDLTIPGGMGGREVIKKLTEIDPQVKAIVSSGYSADPIMANFRQYGFCGVITKPYKIEELSETLYQVMRDTHK